MQRKVALPCGVCRGKGFYICKLCKGNATIEWSPMYDPVAINPCLCPTCEGNRLLSDFILFFLICWTSISSAWYTIFLLCFVWLLRKQFLLCSFIS